MRRIAATACLAVGIVVALAAGLGAGGGGSGYTVRAIFYNAGNVVTGEDVKTAGAKIGSVDSLDVTKDKKAVVVMKIEEAGFTPFRADAECTIRPQGLIGEKFVDCNAGSAPHAELKEVPDGQPGAGQHLLPVYRNHAPVDLDLVNDTLRRPFRERLSILVSEFGTALAGRGDELNKAIHAANPALRDTDRVLAILAEQNRTLSRLAVDSDRVLAPLAARRRRVSDFVVQANTTAQATAERSDALMRTFERFPSFLRELKPTLADLGALSDQMTPVLVDLGRAAPSLNRFVLELGPFSKAATPALRSLGDAADVGRPALTHSHPLIRQLVTFGRKAKPLSTNLDRLTANLDKSGGIERILDYIFYQATAINGFDGISHYLRAELLTNLCSQYTTTPVGGCSANYTATRSIPGGSAAKLDPSLERLRRALREGAGGDKAAGSGGGDAPRRPAASDDPFQALRDLVNPAVSRIRNGGVDRIRRGVRNGSPAYGQRDATDAALDYLLGSSP
ncbi:MAG TPA: MlaD family protein [Thermoleophilaceae bacterium]|jgi:virulence factor Mce-like protein